jgi:hypothetical protein
MNKPLKNISVKSNVWGKYSCFIEGQRIGTIWLSKFDATKWLVEHITSGECVLSADSDVTEDEVSAFIKRLP